MPVTVVVGGQYGSEGKGKVAHAFARMRGVGIAVRVGGSNSGHTVIDSYGRPRVFRHLPTAAILPNTVCVIGAGSYLDVDVLLREIAEAGLGPNRLVIDRNAVIITDEHKRRGSELGLRDRIGSTGNGTGAAVASRVLRDLPLHFAGNDNRLIQYVGHPSSFLRDRLNKNERIVVEGTQGFGLSVLHSDHYPHATSRDTTAAAFVAEAGLSPLDVDEVVLVIRAFPIRVPGESGPLPNEINWETLSQESGRTTPVAEYSTVAKKLRRVARFDPGVVISALRANNPRTIVLNHLDYIDVDIFYSKAFSLSILSFTKSIELITECNIDFVGLGPGVLVPLERSPKNLANLRTAG